MDAWERMFQEEADTLAFLLGEEFKEEIVTVEQQAMQVLADLHRIEATQHVAHLMLRLPARQPASGFTDEEKATLDDLAAEDEAREAWYTEE